MSHDTAPGRAARVRPLAPSSVSEPAREMLGSAAAGPVHYPDEHDTAAWTALGAAMQETVESFYRSSTPGPDVLHRGVAQLGGVTTYTLRPARLDPEADDPLFLEIHGGALWLGGGDLAWMAGAAAAVERDGTTWCPDYRMPPTHPFPTPLDDCIAVYRRALQERAPHQIVVSGASAGGNLAAATLVRARDEGLPMPAALVLLTPELDLTESGDTFTTNDGIDHVLTSLMPVNRLYAAGHDLDEPYLSPLFADLGGFPPTFLQSGTRDLFLSNTVRMHRRLLAAGVDAELHVFEAMPHGSFGGATPEDLELRAATRRFERRHLAGLTGTS